MMDASNNSLYEAAIAALFAILAERLSPITNAFLENQAKAAINSYNLSVSPDVLRDFGRGAVSLSGLTPTFISVITATLAVLHDQNSPFWWIYAALSFIIIMVLFILRFIGKRNIYKSATGTFKLPFGSKRNVRYVEISSWYIYILNTFFLIICVIFIFYPQITTTIQTIVKFF